MSNAIEARSVGDIVDQDGAVGIAIIDGSEGMKAFLSRRVPDAHVGLSSPRHLVVTAESTREVVPRFVVDDDAFFEIRGLQRGRAAVDVGILDVAKQE